MPAEFKRFGISFQYPDNWALDEQDALAGRKSATVYSPGGALWSVSVHPPSADPAQLAEAAVDAMKQEYPDLEVEQTQETVAGCPLIGYNLCFYCLDMIGAAAVRTVCTDQATYVVFCQAEDREFEKTRIVFHAMTISLLESLKPG